MHQLVIASAVLVIAMGLMMADRGLKLTGSGYDTSSLSSRWQEATQACSHTGIGRTREVSKSARDVAHSVIGMMWAKSGGHIETC